MIYLRALLILAFPKKINIVVTFPQADSSSRWVDSIAFYQVVSNPKTRAKKSVLA